MWTLEYTPNARIVFQEGHMVQTVQEAGFFIERDKHGMMKHDRSFRLSLDGCEITLSYHDLRRLGLLLNSIKILP